MSEGEASSSRSKREQRLFDIQLKLNAARKANKKEVTEEHQRTNGKRKSRTEPNDNDKVKVDDHQYYNDTMVEALGKKKKQEKKKQQQASFGWDVFNQDALFKSYEKRLDKLPCDQSSGKEGNIKIDEWNYGKIDDTSEEGKNRLVAELAEQASNRKTFSRRRQHYEGKDVDYINERNKHFNEKLSRAYNKYTVELGQNLERGTAL